MFDQSTAYPQANVIEIDFLNYDQWIMWRQQEELNALEACKQILAHTKTQGLWEPVTRRHFTGDLVSWDLNDARETGVAGGLNSRLRATLYALHSCLGDLNPYHTKIYGAEAYTPFALLMRGHFTKYIGSEYTLDPAKSEELFPILNEDLTNLSFGNAKFDAVVTNEVLEHVPNLDKALAEVARILRPGGWHVGTCPFRYMDEVSQLRTIMENGVPKHLLPPEWHGDPMGTGGSLVFEIPAWDILERARAAGFRQVFWKYLRSHTFGITANEIGGIFVLCLGK